MSVRGDLSLRYEYHLYRLLKPWWVNGDKIDWDISLFAVTACSKRVRWNFSFTPTPLNNVLTPFRLPVGKKKTNNPNLYEGMGERSQQILSSIWASANCLLLIVSYFLVDLLTSACPAALTSSKQAPLRPSWHFCFVYMVCPSGTKKRVKRQITSGYLGKISAGRYCMLRMSDR